MSGLRTLRNRLAVAFGLIVLGAIGTIYLSVTPRLEERLRQQKLDTLVNEGKRYRRDIARLVATDTNAVAIDELVGRAAAASSTELLVLTRTRGTTQSVSLVTDSTPDGGVQLADVGSVALDAIEGRRAATSTEPTPVGRQALAAQPLIRQRKVLGALVFADSLTDVQANVALIRRQILISGGGALLIALLAGYLVARALSKRVDRLELAARKVAAGDFSNP